MTAGEIAGLIAAVAFVLLVGALAVPLLRLGRLLSSLERDVVRGGVVPLLEETTGALGRVTAELARVEDITAHVQSITVEAQSVATNVSALTSLFAATLGSPVIKVAAFSYGVRRAVTKKNRAELEELVRAVRKEQGKRSKRQDGQQDRQPGAAAGAGAPAGPDPAQQPVASAAGRGRRR